MEPMATSPADTVAVTDRERIALEVRHAYLAQTGGRHLDCDRFAALSASSRQKMRVRRVDRARQALKNELTAYIRD